MELVVHKTKLNPYIRIGKKIRLKLSKIPNNYQSLRLRSNNEDSYNTGGMATNNDNTLFFFSLS